MLRGSRQLVGELADVSPTSRRVSGSWNLATNDRDKRTALYSGRLPATDATGKLATSYGFVANKFATSRGIYGKTDLVEFGQHVLQCRNGLRPV